MYTSQAHSTQYGLLSTDEDASRYCVQMPGPGCCRHLLQAVSLRLLLEHLNAELDLHRASAHADVTKQTHALCV